MRSGGGQWSEPELVASGNGTGEEYVRSVPLVEGHPSQISWRLNSTLDGHPFVIEATSPAFDRGFVANITQLDYEFDGDRLWVLVAGDSDTRREGYCIIGDAAAVIDTAITLEPANFSFFLKHSRGPKWIDTGIDVPAAAGVTSGVIAVRANDANGVEGPVATMPYEREGSGGGGAASIDSFTMEAEQNGTSCADKAECKINFVVTADPTDTVTLERYVDDVLDATPINASTTHSRVDYMDAMPFWATGGIGAKHFVKYRLLVKDSGGAELASQYSVDELFSGVVDC
jgi:hypothetical protein